MTTTETLEALMLGSFSIGWYWSIFAMVWTRRPYGKNAAFVACTIAGYGFGLTAKILLWSAGAPFSYLIVLYSWNLLMTVIDMWLFIKFSRKTTALQNLQALSIPVDLRATTKTYDDLSTDRGGSANLSGYYN